MSVIFQIGYITIDGKDYPVFLTGDGMYRMTETGATEKIYVKRSEIHESKIGRASCRERV